MITLGGIDAYEVGNREAGKAILVFPDLWGWDSGRTRGVCDALAKETGAYVLAPGVVRSWWWMSAGPTGFTMPLFAFWAYMYAGASATNPQFTQHVEPHLQKLGITKYAVTGFCLGCMNAVNSAAVAKTKPAAAFLFHPSFQAFGRLGSPEMASALKDMRAPTLIFASKNDPDVVQEGGEAQKAIREAGVECTVKRVEQAHGWMNRGDVSEPSMKKDVQDALDATVAFLKDKL